jgi:hypothetical protein
VFRQTSSGVGQINNAFHAGHPLSSNFASFDDYPPAFRRLSTGAPNQTLRPIAPLQVHPQDYHAARDPPYDPYLTQFTPALGNDGFSLDPSPAPPTSEIPRTFHSAPQPLFGEGGGGSPYGLNQRRASILGPSPEYQQWAGDLPAETLHDRPSIARSNTLTSFNPVSDTSISQTQAGVFHPTALPNNEASSQFSSPTENVTHLTSTQIAAFGSQPLPPDHPFYSEMKGHVYDGGSGTDSNGKSTPIKLKSEVFLCKSQLLR